MEAFFNAACSKCGAVRAVFPEDDHARLQCYRCGAIFSAPEQLDQTSIIAEPIDLRRTGQRPLEVQYSIKLLCVWLGLSIITSLMTVINLADLFRPTQIVFSLLAIGVPALKWIIFYTFYSAILRRRDWVRFVMGLFSLAALPYIFIVLTSPSSRLIAFPSGPDSFSASVGIASPSFALVQNLIGVVANCGLIIATILLFTPSGARWFQNSNRKS